eukprot:9483237-Pyramimonas_sp.AAC.1
MGGWRELDGRSEDEEEEEKEEEEEEEVDGGGGRRAKLSIDTFGKLIVTRLVPEQVVGMSRTTRSIGIPDSPVFRAPLGGPRRYGWIRF